MHVRPATAAEVLAWARDLAVPQAQEQVGDRAVAAVLAAVVAKQAEARDLAPTAATQATIAAMLGAAGADAQVEVPYAVAVAGPTAAGVVHEGLHGQRKASGAYYTPPALVDRLLDHVLDPVLARVPHAEVAGVRLLDPACGGGNFLVPALERIAGRLRDGGHGDADARRLAARCVVGIDVDPVAVVLARLALWLAVGDSRLPPTAFADQVRLGDALFGHAIRDDVGLDRAAFEPGPADERRVATRWRRDWDRALARDPDLVSRALAADTRLALDALVATWDAPKVVGSPQVLGVLEALADGAAPPEDALDVVREVARERRPLHWPLAVPEAWHGFDVVVGNPPYVKARAHGREHPALRRRLTRTHPACRGGQWNLFVPFVALAADLLRAGGRSALLVPNAVLAADFVAPLHEHLRGRVEAVLDFTRADLFDEAAVHVAALVTVAEAVEDRPVRFVVHDADLDEVRTREVEASLLARLPAGYWCLPVLAADLEVPEGRLLDLLAWSTTIGDVATVRDGASTSEAYALKPLLREARPDDDATTVVRFANTGTIDPDRLLWGEREAVYLGRRLLRPVVDRAALADAFPRRLAEAERPKVLLAGLSSRLEAVADPDGEVLCGKSAVQVLVNDASTAKELADWLNRPELSALYRALFGLAGFGGAGMNVAPALVGRLPAPPGPAST